MKQTLPHITSLKEKLQSATTIGEANRISAEAQLDREIECTEAMNSCGIKHAAERAHVFSMMS